MITIFNKQKFFFLLVLILIIGAFLRFYKLNWGDGLFTHPDEYHIVASIAQLSFPTQMHPHFFSYGTVTIYIIYFTQELLKNFPPIHNSQFIILNSFIVGRFYSALFSTLTIFVVYKICRAFLKSRFSLLASLLVALTPGLIQQAHFATPESALTFFLFLSLLFSIKFLKYNKFFYLLFASIALGFALGVKVSSIVFLLPLTLAIILKSSKNPLRLINFIIVNLMTVFLTFFLVAPYVFLDHKSFQSNLDYEGGLAVGKIPVFYTRQFIDTMPVLFQIEKILPYALGPVLFLFSSLGFMLAVINLIRKPKIEIIILVLAFLSLFLTNGFLFAKWTRFIAPTFPFFAIFAAFLLEEFTKKSQVISYFLKIFLLLATILWTTAFFSIYTKHDIRITASKWLVANIPAQSVILIEGGNMIDIPLQGNFTRLGFDFYNFEENQETRTEIAKGLEKADYFLVQSRRVFLNHQRARKYFPKTAHFYDMLFAGKMGFEQIKEFRSYPSLEIGNWKLEIPDEIAEETWSVFDHPVIRVFKKNTQLSKQDYEKIF